MLLGVSQAHKASNPSSVLAKRIVGHFDRPTTYVAATHSSEPISMPMVNDTVFIKLLQCEKPNRVQRTISIISLVTIGASEKLPTAILGLI
jgi:hypothetical protein